jgi:MATE family multidrug resistance protein
MNTRSEVVQNLRLAVPVMLSQLGHVMMGVADNIMVGKLGATALAAAGLANVAFNVLLLFGIGVSYAITPLVAQADGEKDAQGVSHILRHGLAINLITGFLLAWVVFFGKNILYYIGQPGDVVTLSIPYLNIVTVSIIPVLLFQTFRQLSEGLSNTRLAMTIVLSANVLNIFLNYVLIYGHWGFPALGLNGAGYATLISRVAMGLGIAWYVYQAPFFRKYRAGFQLKNYSSKLFSKMLHIGIPAGLQFIFEVAAFDFSLVMMGWISTQALAAHQIAINLATISYMTTSGLAAAATIRVGQELGRNDIPNLRHAAFVIIRMALVWMTCWAVVFIAGRSLLPQLYVQDADVVALAAPLIVIAGLFQLSDGLQVVSVGALRGLQDVKIPSLLIFISYWVIALPLGYWMAFHLHWGAVGIWSGLLIGLTLVALAVTYRFHRLSNSLLASTSRADEIDKHR